MRLCFSAVRGLTLVWTAPWRYRPTRKPTVQVQELAHMSLSAPLEPVGKAPPRVGWRMRYSNFQGATRRVSIEAGAAGPDVNPWSDVGARHLGPHVLMSR
ncbi:uncharacterized protein BJ171DRAFT_490629 [Polychytrium aggregatum]|uniref:uncharacterized protein n=1 Tax=Polychytrium aggregatum TaxID=110093 RepID=UPI0022FF029A|nr:uncharacterized protein BJ171DRAFT_490629 [Polychytrium aggregatum]KAI9208203.1 hypothetical protein BJ171DRAFT_490629 [Polychytrium aggregatum]